MKFGGAYATHGKFSRRVASAVTFCLFCYDSSRFVSYLFSDPKITAVLSTVVALLAANITSRFMITTVNIVRHFGFRFRLVANSPTGLI